MMEKEKPYVSMYVFKIKVVKCIIEVRNLLLELELK